MFKSTAFLFVLVLASCGASRFFSEYDDREEIDYLLSGLGRNGDANRVWPTSFVGVERELCSVYLDDIMKLLEYIERRYPDINHLIMITKIMATDKLKFFVSVCRSMNSRANAIRWFKAANSKIGEIRLARQQLINALAAAKSPSTNINLSQIICFYGLYSKTFISSFTVPENRNPAITIAEDYHKAIFPYMTRHINLTVTSDCDFSKVPRVENTIHHNSIELALLEALANILKKSAGPV